MSSKSKQSASVVASFNRFALRIPRFRLSLRWALVLVALFGILLSLRQVVLQARVPYLDARTEAKLLAALPPNDRIIINGQEELISPESNPFVSDPGVTKSWPRKLRTSPIAWKLAGLTPTTHVRLQSYQPVDLTLYDDIFGSLPELRHVAIDGRTISLSNDQITSLLTNTQLESLRLYEIDVSRAHLASLGHMGQLKQLSLRKAGLNSRDIAFLDLPASITFLNSLARFWDE